MGSGKIVHTGFGIFLSQASIYLGQWFSNFSMHWDYPEGLSKYRFHSSTSHSF